MGDMADYYSEREYESNEEDSWEQRLESKHIWPTKDGRQLLIAKMEDSHLVNTVRYLERTLANNLWPQYDVMLAEIERRKQNLCV